jgi:hypothetical protein
VKTIIPSNEISFHPLSFQDEAGRLFQWRGGLYRGISAGSAPFLAQLVQGDALRDLVPLPARRLARVMIGRRRAVGIVVGSRTE